MVPLYKLAEIFDSSVIREVVKDPRITLRDTPAMFVQAVKMLERFLKCHCTDYTIIDPMLQNYIGSTVLDKLVKLRMSGVIADPMYVAGAIGSIPLIRELSCKYKMGSAINGAILYNQLETYKELILPNDHDPDQIELAEKADSLDIVLVMNPCRYDDLKAPVDDIHRVIEFGCVKITKHLMAKYPNAIASIRDMPQYKFIIRNPSPELYALLKANHCDDAATVCHVQAINKNHNMEPYLDIDYGWKNKWPIDYDNMSQYEYDAANGMFRAAFTRRNLDEMKYNYELGIKLEPLELPDNTDNDIRDWLETVGLLAKK